MFCGNYSTPSLSPVSTPRPRKVLRGNRSTYVLRSIFGSRMPRIQSNPPNVRPIQAGIFGPGEVPCPIPNLLV
ncbi:uncharacterized protein EURHEDRAFT_341182 [Aspergillus ruber CBS 135680]|uniref:Uncharacterized protein n=1 Tax=Aspergillus ruber (strain CBS 135680) TaxID=1388766 RepID=A0A017SJL0_ASPRC|nr:uncharacterized protein EURHEDRAFT_341182 [Aspergillus ruber CBS 135680]EYE96859.1 hypothetical protein EURHEDRAFT_341182 [Aspergillus ruber CBS 135680]